MSTTTLRSALLGLLLVFAAAAHAMDLDAAKSRGLVGERADGYLGIVVANPSAEVEALVEEVNGKRRDRYEEIARSNGIEVSEVEALAGQKAIEKTASGGWVFRVRWTQKP